MKKIDDKMKLLIKNSIISGACYTLGAAIGSYAIKKFSKVLADVSGMKDADVDWSGWEDKDVEGTEDLD